MIKYFQTSRSFNVFTCVYIHVTESTIWSTFFSIVLIGPRSAIKANAVVIIIALPRFVAKLLNLINPFNDRYNP